MQVYLTNQSAETSLRAATLRQKLQINFQPNPVTVYWHQANQSQQTLQHQAPGWTATGEPTSNTLVVV